MNVGQVSSSLIARMGRMDAGFLLLAQQHLALVDELIARFTREELLDLAGKLPFDAAAAKKVAPSTRVEPSYYAQPSKFLLWLGRQSNLNNIAVYVAAAGQYAASKLLTEVLELAKQKLALVKRTQGLLNLAKEKKADLLFAAFKAGGQKKVEEAKAHNETRSETTPA